MERAGSQPISRRTAIKLLGGTIAAGGLAWEFPGTQAVAAPRVKASPTTPIEHVIFIMLENHTYDSLFGSFNPKGENANGKTSAAAPNPLYSDIIPSHCHYLASFLPSGRSGFDISGLVSYQESDIPTYWN